MTLEIRNPCEERWDEMAPRGEGRHCRRCERTVVDLSRMTRAQAEARVARARGRICLALRMDAATHAPIFRPEPARAPHWAGGVVLAAALTAGCASRPERATESIAAEPEATLAPPAAELGPPMEPLSAIAMAEPRMVTRAVPADELAPPPESGEPTAEQRRLTQRKQRPTHCALPPPPPYPSTYMMLGF